jgi:hypothetical protein
MPALLCINDNFGSRVRGDVLQVWPIDHVFRPGESKAAWIADGRDAADWPNIFFLLNIDVGDAAADAVAVENMRVTLIELDTDDVLESDASQPSGFRVRAREIKRRKRYLAVDALPSAVKNTIRDEGEITVSPVQIRPYFRHKETDQTVELGL